MIRTAQYATVGCGVGAAASWLAAIWMHSSEFFGTGIVLVLCAAAGVAVIGFAVASREFNS